MPDRGGPEVSARSKFLYARYLSIVLAIAGVVALTLLPMPYVIFSPGPRSMCSARSRAAK